MQTTMFMIVLEPAPAWLHRKNRFIVIGTTDGIKPITVDGVSRLEPRLIAECIHVWRTQGSDIASFPFETGAGYYPLEER